MAPLKVGDQFPKGVKFDYVPIENDDPTVCGRPQEYDADAEFRDKKVILVSVPGAFTPGCQANHLPPYIKRYDEIKSKGVDVVAFIAFNDAWVMNAWAKVNKVPADNILFLSDTKTFFSKDYASMLGDTGRNARWAMVIEKDGTVSYAETEKAPGEVNVSGVEAVMAKL